MADRHVRFALGDEGQMPYAVQLRLTPQMLAAIQSSSAAGVEISQQQQHSIQFDPESKKTVVSISGEEFHFKTLADQGCSVMKIDKEQAIVKGSISQKLQPVRTIADTAASLAATAAAEAATGAEKPIAEGPALPPSTRNLHASLPPSPAHPIISPLDTQKGGLPPALLEIPSDLIFDDLLRGALLEVAAKRGSLRLVLISLLIKHPTGLRTIKAVVRTLHERIAGFRYPEGSGNLENVLKKVAKFQAPGSYVLFSELENEILPILAEAQAIQYTENGAEERRMLAATRNEKKRQRAASPTSLPSSSGGTITATAASRPLSSSSRGSGGADESWVLEHAERLPEPPPILKTATQYHTANTEFQHRYQIYFKLHQLLSANRRDFEALQAAVDDASSLEEKERIEGEVERLWARRARRSRRWEAAFQVLHQELGQWKNVLGAFASSPANAEAINALNNNGYKEGGDIEEI